MKIPKINKKHYTIVLSEKHRLILEEIAAKEKQSFSKVIEFALEQLNGSY